MRDNFEKVSSGSEIERHHLHTSKSEASLKGWWGVLRYVTNKWTNSKRGLDGGWHQPNRTTNPHEPSPCWKFDAVNYISAGRSQAQHLCFRK